MIVFFLRCSLEGTPIGEPTEKCIGAVYTNDMRTNRLTVRFERERDGMNHSRSEQHLVVGQKRWMVDSLLLLLYGASKVFPCFFNGVSTKGTNLEARFHQIPAIKQLFWMLVEECECVTHVRTSQQVILHHL